MAEARCRADWARTSAFMALAVNLVRDPRRTPAAKPNDFNPYAPRPKKPILRGKQLEILRDVFVPKELNEPRSNHSTQMEENSIGAEGSKLNISHEHF